MLQLITIYEKNPHTRKINLMFMNIKDITSLTTVLYKFRYLQEITFHGNKLTSLPSLELNKNLVVLDVSNNPIKIDQFTLNALYQSKQLKHLYIDCNQQERKLIIQNLPNLLYLNGQLIVRQQIANQTLQQQLAILQKRLSDQMLRTKQIYNKMIKIYTQNKEQQIKIQWQAKNYDQQFSFLLREIKEQMTYFYSGLQDKLSSQGVYAYCKNKLTIVFDNLIIRLLDELGNQAMVKIYQQLSKVKAQNFQLLLKIILNTSYQQYIDNQFSAPNNRLRKQTLYQNQIFRLKKEIIQLKNDKNTAKMFQNNKYQVLQDKKKQFMLEKSVNRQMGKFSKDSVFTPKSYQNQNMKIWPVKQQNLTIKINQSSKNISKSPSNANMKISPSSRNMNKSPSNTNIKRSMSSKNIHKSNNSQLPLKSDQTISSLKTTANKITNLDQLSKLIDQIMTQKRKDNTKNLTKNDIFTTAEEFMFIFFSRRYGLKEVALQWTLAMIKAIEIYCKQSIQVEIFGKILKNNLYQEYYDEVKRFTREIDKLLSSINIKTGISQQQLRKIFFYLFSEERQQSFTNIAQKLSFPMSITSLHHLLQSYKLSLEQKYLHNFRHLFQKFDSDDDGCLSLNQAKQLIFNLIKSSKQIEQFQMNRIIQFLCSNLDTLRKDKLIFSELFQIVHKYL